MSSPLLSVPSSSPPEPVRVEGEPRVVAPPPRPTITRRLDAWWVVAVVLALALAVATGRLLWGGVLLSAALGLGALLRLLLPSERAGGLVVRSRALDVGVMLVLAAALLVSALTLDLRPR